MILVTVTKELLKEEEVCNSKFLSEFIQSNLEMFPAEKSTPPWVGYLAKDGGRYVGACAFKSVPTEVGVEIAYFTFPEFEGKGVATQMARELLEIAKNAGVAVVRAQTLPKVSASTKLLEKLGFSNIGSVLHPEDGEVWEWKREMGV